MAVVAEETALLKVSLEGTNSVHGRMYRNK
jgi:hypothetical protein